MRKTDPGRGTDAAGDIRRTRIPAGQGSPAAGAGRKAGPAGGTRKAEPVSLGAILSDGALRRKRRRKRGARAVLLAVCLILLSAVTFFLLRNYLDAGPLFSGDASSLSAGSSVSGGDSDPSASGAGSLSGSISGPSSGSGSNPVSVSADSAARADAFQKLQGDVNTFAYNFDGRIGIYYLNLSNGETFGFGETNPFVAASSIKMGIVTQLYKSVAEGKLDLTQMLTYDNRPYPTGDLEYGTGIIVNEENGAKFSVRRTAQLAITISDNCATNMIIRALGGIDTVIPSLNEISSAVPYRTSVSYTNYKGVLVSGRHRTSAKDLALYAKYLYERWKADPDSYAPLMEDLENTVFTFGVQSKLPTGVQVAHKIGTNYDYRTENDVGIIFAREPYILCVTTECESQPDGRAAAADVSLMFYDYITGLGLPDTGSAP